MREVNMKLLLALTLVFSSAAQSIVVSGDLLDNIKLDGPIQKMIFTANKTEIALVNEFNEVASCEEGEFELSDTGNGNFKLERVVKCEKWVDQTKDVQFCPEVYMPVCGELKSEAGSKALPELAVFSNMCELYISKATFIKMGSCN